MLCHSISRMIESHTSTPVRFTLRAALIPCTIVVAALMTSALIACEEEDEEPTPAPVQSDQRPFDQPPAGGSKSALGKARDAAVSVRDRMQERDAEIGKMADDVFKTSPPSETPTETPE